MLTCGSPWLFAAYRVLLRQSVPWHPPCALTCLIFSPSRLRPPGLPPSGRSRRSFASSRLHRIPKTVEMRYRLLICVCRLPLPHFRLASSVLPLQSLRRNQFLSCAVFKVRPGFARTLPPPPFAPGVRFRVQGFLRTLKTIQRFELPVSMFYRSYGLSACRSQQVSPLAHRPKVYELRSRSAHVSLERR